MEKSPEKVVHRAGEDTGDGAVPFPLAEAAAITGAAPKAAEQTPAAAVGDGDAALPVAAPNAMAAVLAAAPEGPPTSLAPGRDVHMDVLKGIGMILVIIGHMRTMEYLGYSFVAYIYTFHMPLFFFINGFYFARLLKKGKGFGSFLGKRALRLLVPYCLFFAFSFLWTNTVYAYAWGVPMFGFDFDPLAILQAFLLAGEYLQGLAVVPFPLWFLHALFFASIALYFIVKLRNRWILALVAVLLAALALPLQSAMAASPLWVVRLLPVALFFMLVGYLCNGWAASPAMRQDFKLKRVVNSFLALACLLAGLFFMQEGRGDMWSISSYWYYPGALVSIAGCYLLARESTNAILRFTGYNSLYYLALHALILSLPFVEDLPNWFLGRGFDGIVIYIGYLVVAFVLISLLVVVVRGVVRLFLGLLRRLVKGERISKEITI